MMSAELKCGKESILPLPFGRGEGMRVRGGGPVLK